ncbi:hypothetical protein DFH06DRAFT_1186500 [Mycena polygramma]|nr:hypothetical protein DFH06DRAFT_1186500 [Mycena polygramma]
MELPANSPHHVPPGLGLPFSQRTKSKVSLIAVNPPSWLRQGNPPRIPNARPESTESESKLRRALQWLELVKEMKSYTPIVRDLASGKMTAPNALDPSWMELTQVMDKRALLLADKRTYACISSLLQCLGIHWEGGKRTRRMVKVEEKIQPDSPTIFQGIERIMRHPALVLLHPIELGSRFGAAESNDAAANTSRCNLAFVPLLRG